MLVAEQLVQPLALDHQRIERREDMDWLGLGRRRCQLLGTRPMLDPLQADDAYRRQLPAAHAPLDQRTDARLVARVQVADGVQADDALSAQRPVQQIGQNLRLARRTRLLVPAEMPLDQLVGLEHALPLADGDEAGHEGKLQHALGRLAAGPGMVLLDQQVILDVADRQRPLALDAGKHPPQIALADLGVPRAGRPPARLHRRQIEPQILRRHIGKRVGPVLEHRLVDSLDLVQVGANVGRDAGEQDVVMRPLDHVDGVDLDIAQMLDRGLGRGGAGAERGRLVKPLRRQPKPPGLGDGQAMVDRGARHPAKLAQPQLGKSGCAQF